MADFAGGWILHPRFPAPRRVDVGLSTLGCSVSPDGRWVAFGLVTSDRDRIKVYDAARCTCVWESPPERGIFFRFSPDGRWLVTDVDDGRLFAVGTWEPGPRLGAGVPVAMTGELAILGQTNGIYRLVELATGKELARLEDPEQNVGPAAFTPDGGKLVVAAKNGLRVWDLRRIRAELATLNLDWEAAPIPQAPTGNAVPLRVQVDPADLGMTADQKRSYWATQVAVTAFAWS
jgi:WD40 repeat protein